MCHEEEGNEWSAKISHWPQRINRLDICSEWGLRGDGKPQEPRGMLACQSNDDGQLEVTLRFSK